MTKVKAIHTIVFHYNYYTLRNKRRKRKKWIMGRQSSFESSCTDCVLFDVGQVLFLLLVVMMSPVLACFLFFFFFFFFLFIPPPFIYLLSSFPFFATHYFI